MKTLTHLRESSEPQLQLIAEAGFERDLVSACFDNLEGPGPLRFNNFAYALRELLRHVFHRLAPDNLVEECSWFRPDPQATGGITRSDRAKYMIQGGLSDLFVQKRLGVNVAPVLSELSDAFKLLNSFTHIGPTTFDLPADKVNEFATQCLEASRSLVANIAGCRRSVLENLASAIDDHLLRKAISETINELDELATHHLIEDIDVESSEVVDIGTKWLVLDVQGSVGVELQYGSNSDVRNDIGGVISNSFPFTAKVHVKFEKPLGRHVEVRGFKVDTSSWYE